MNEAKFTKGEWVARTEEFGGMQIALVYVSGGGFDVSGAPNAIANAHLIAAAPEMYEMLKLAISLMDGDSIEDFGYQYQEIQTLLTKARGES